MDHLTTNTNPFILQVFRQAAPQALTPAAHHASPWLLSQNLQVRLCKPPHLVPPSPSFQGAKENVGMSPVTSFFAGCNTRGHRDPPKPLGLPLSIFCGAAAVLLHGMSVCPAPRSSDRSPHGFASPVQPVCRWGVFPGQGGSPLLGRSFSGHVGQLGHVGFLPAPALGYGSRVVGSGL